MYQPVTLSWSNLLLSLSDALDMASPEIAQHQLRTAFITWELGKAARMPAEALEQLFIAALFHDVGALTPEEKIRIHKKNATQVHDHCILGEKFLRQKPEFAPISRIVRFHHTKWKDWKVGHKESVVFESQILFLADMLERLIDRETYILHQHKDLVAQIEAMSNKEVCPEIVALLKTVAVREDFWLDIVSPRLYSLLLREGPCRGKKIDMARFSAISELFRMLIDFRSSFTATHSAGVAASASAIAALSNLPETDEESLKLAGNLHDLGKLVVPHALFIKPGALTKDEFSVVRQHTYFTYSILTTVRGIENIAEWAAFHHERLDGTGYPFHVDAGTLSMGSRIMAVADIFTALAEDRSYRKGMGKKAVLAILKNHGKEGGLDKNYVEIVEKHYEKIVAEMKKAQTEAQIFYNQVFT